MSSLPHHLHNLSWILEIPESDSILTIVTFIFFLIRKYWKAKVTLGVYAYDDSHKTHTSCIPNFSITER